MKQLLALSFVLLVSMSAMMAQGFKLQSAGNYLDQYQRGEGADYLIKAKENIDEAAVHEKTSEQGKTWYYRGIIYQSIYDEKEIAAQFETIDFRGEAFDSFKKAIDLDDNKFKDSKTLYTYALQLSILYFNDGIDNYSNKEYAQAYMDFLGAAKVNGFLKEHEQQTHINDGDALGNAALAAQAAGMMKEAIKVYQDVIDNGTDDPGVYRALANLYKADGNMDKAKEVVAAGLEQFPENVDLLIDDLNFYLAEDKSEEAIDKMKKAIELDPDNDQLRYVMGTAYDKMGDFENAKLAYEAALEINPDNFNAMYNIGAIYFNQAGAIQEEMNNLGFSAADQQKYKELKAERDELFKEALPFFEKASEMNPEDEEVQKAITKINSFLATE